ncbi:MAG: nucleoside-diphosphate sugar epimerase/dehydratase [Rhodobacterales bacterium]|nr:nucleoside-diphosphate sugar epimerase/dehydratase [Rhodobacterales bacterium]
MLRFVTHLSRPAKQAIIIVIDVVLIPFAILAAFSLQLNALPPLEGLLRHWQAVPLLMMIGALLAVVMGIHKIQLKAFENRAIGMTAIHAMLMGLSIAILDDIADYGTPFATFITFTLVYFLMVCCARVTLLQFLLSIYRLGQDQVRVLIYGAGRTGQQLAAALKTDDTIMAMAFVDDNKALQSTIVQGLHVYSPVTIATLARDKGVKRVLLAMPNLSRPQLAQVTRRIEDIGLAVQALPSFAQLAGNEGRLADQLRPVSPGQFLGRVALDRELPGGSETYASRSILISGAGGSIGSELCRQVLSCGPKRLVMLEISELALYTIEMELRELADRMSVEVVPVLGSVGDMASMRRVLTEYKIDTVLHAAAYKHVPMVELNPIAGFSNNVLGTHTLAIAAAEAQVKRFILISTDKAVRPKNLMGASKRLAEIVVQDLASRSNGAAGKTIYSMVRFGNVIGSSGSVIPLFQDQITRGGPVTLTHRDVTRYFMTIPEAARLVLVAGTFATGGEVFVLDMGDPVHIYDLARQMIEASGYSIRDEKRPDGDIEIVLTGLRPGEKMHEELLIGEGQITTPHPKILQAREEHLSEIEVAAGLKALRAAIADADADALRAVVVRFVEGGQHFLPRTDRGKRPNS